MANKTVDIFIKGHDQATGVFNSLAGKIKSTFGSLGGQLASVLGGFGIKHIIEASVEAFSEQELAVTKLSAALGSLNEKYRTQVPALVEFAEAIEKVTTFSHKDIEALEALGASAGKLSGENLKAATVAAIGLSTAFNKDLTTSMRLVLKAMDGNFTAFKKLGITFKAGATDSEKLAQVMQRGIDGFKQQEEQINSTSGKLKQFHNAMESISEHIGGAFAPALVSTISTIRDFAEANEAIIPPLIMAAGGIIGVSVALGLLTPAAKLAAAALGLVSGELGLAVIAGAAFGAALSGQTLSEIGSNLKTFVLHPLLSIEFAALQVEHAMFKLAAAMSVALGGPKHPKLTQQLLRDLQENEKNQQRVADEISGAKPIEQLNKEMKEFKERHLQRKADMALGIGGGLMGPEEKKKEDLEKPGETFASGFKKALATTKTDIQKFLADMGGMKFEVGKKSGGLFGKGGFFGKGGGLSQMFLPGDKQAFMGALETIQKTTRENQAKSIGANLLNAIGGGPAMAIGALFGQAVNQLGFKHEREKLGERGERGGAPEAISSMAFTGVGLRGTAASQIPQRQLTVQERHAEIAAKQLQADYDHIDLLQAIKEGIARLPAINEANI